MNYSNGIRENYNNNINGKNSNEMQNNYQRQQY